MKCTLIDGTALEIQNLEEINDKQVAGNILELYCNSNQLTSLVGLEECQYLQELYCYNNRLKTLKGLEGCQYLRKLYCYSNQLETLKEIEGYVNLQELVEKYNIISEYYDIYKQQQDTCEECIICDDTDFTLYIKCQHGHIICNDCFELYEKNKECCVCYSKYDVKYMFYSKNIT